MCSMNWNEEPFVMARHNRSRLHTRDRGSDKMLIGIEISGGNEGGHLYVANTMASGHLDGNMS